jgi:hypothetical protein
MASFFILEKKEWRMENGKGATVLHSPFSLLPSPLSIFHFIPKTGHFIPKKSILTI